MKVPTKDLENLYAALLVEERIMKSRLSVRNLQKLARKRLCVFEKDGKGIYAFAALWPTRSKYCFELGTCWIREDKRGKGLFSDFFDRIIKRSRMGSVVFLITKSAKVAHEAHKRGWIEARGWQTCTKWQNLCDPVGGLQAESARTFTENCRLFHTIG